MDDRKLRERALTKVKAKISNLTLILVVAFILYALPYLLFGSRGFKWALVIFAAKFMSLMFTVAGTVYVGVDAWRHSKATWGGFLIAFRSFRPLKALCVPFALTSAFYGFAGVSTLKEALIILLIAWVIEYASRWIAYYLFLEEDKSPMDCVKGGLSALKANLARIIKMELVLRLWMWILAALIAVGCYYALNISAVFAAAVGAFFMASFTYAIGSYNALAQAGLARAIIKGSEA